MSGVVGLQPGGLGGFILPIMFGALLDLTGVRTSCFMLLYGTVCVSLVWMHYSFKPALLSQPAGGLTPHSSAAGLCAGGQPSRAAAPLAKWRLCNPVHHHSLGGHPTFWQQEGKTVARHQFVDFHPALTWPSSSGRCGRGRSLNMPANIELSRSLANQLFWLAALPALSAPRCGFFSFMVPVFGGRKWTALSTAVC